MHEHLVELLTHRSGLKQLLDEDGDASLRDYFRGIQNHASLMSSELLEILQLHTKNLLDPSLIQGSIIHTADHMGILNHPFFWSSKAAQKPHYTIVLATGNTSPSNSSHPRGITWHDQELREKRSFFVPLSWRQYAMYGIPAITQKEYEKFLDSLPAKLQETFSAVKHHDLLHKKWLSEQLCQINTSVWRQCFGANSKLLYIELEAVINQLLLNELEKKSGSLYSLITDQEIQEKYVRYFDGLQGAHDLRLNKGSQLFWYLDRTSKKRYSMQLQDGSLKPDNGTVIKLSPTNLKKHLEQRTLMPTLALSYALLAAEHGATLAGGFSQIDYLPKIISAWNKLFSHSATTKGDVFAGEVGLIGLSHKDKHTLATLADILLYTNTVAERTQLIERASNVTLREAVESIADQLLRIVSPHKTQLTPAARTGEIIHV